MANIISAKKRARQAVVRREHNVMLTSRMRTAVKKVLKAIQSGDKTVAEQAYRAAMPVVDSSVNKGLIHRNKAARHKSRLNARIRAMQ
ncbi:30S ribosomal protein S20 [Acidihalobacter prosperus]